MKQQRLDLMIAVVAPTLVGIFLSAPSYSFAPVPPPPVQTLTSQQASGSPSREKPLRFDAASIKPFGGDGGSNNVGDDATRTKAGSAGGGLLRFSPGRIATAAIGVTTRKIILEAFRMTQYQVWDGPSWIDSERFDLEAVADGANEDQLRQMLQTLLAERFKLAIRRETREMPLYRLVVARSGSRLKEWKEGDPMPESGADDRLKFTATGTLQHLADLLSGVRAVGRPVLDKTSLTGAYLFHVVWDPREDFLPAMQEQLGLKLESDKGPVSCIVIDRIEKPEAN
jgi:uncharacterized protein (TIGR03435 family)